MVIVIVKVVFICLGKKTCLEEKTNLNFIKKYIWNVVLPSEGTKTLEFNQCR